MNGEGEEVGVDRLRELFAGQPSMNPREATDAILEAVSAFAGGYAAV